MRSRSSLSWRMAPAPSDVPCMRCTRALGCTIHMKSPLRIFVVVRLPVVISWRNLFGAFHHRRIGPR